MIEVWNALAIVNFRVQFAPRDLVYKGCGVEPKSNKAPALRGERLNEKSNDFLYDFSD